jgi:hypothetical protein
LLSQVSPLRAHQELARRKLWRFCLYYDEDFFSKRPFLEQVAEGFQKIESGEILSLSVSMPPRAGKSYITSLAAAWVLGRHPHGSVMRNTCTATLYDKFSYDTRSIVRTTKYREVFPEVELASDKQNLTGWNLKQSRQVGYFGAGVGGTIIGFGATLIAITDDLYKDMSEALSSTRNAAIKQWKQSAHDSRLEKHCPIVDIGTRWSRNDVIGEKREAKKYDLSIVIPALDANDKSFCEDVKTTDEYLKIRADLIAANSMEIWLAEYQQEPAEVQGLLFRKSEIKRFTMEEFSDETKIESILGYIDPAEGGGDAMAFILGQITKGKVFITDVIYSSETVEVSIPRCATLINKRNANYIRVEKNGLGSGFIRDLRRVVNTEKILPANNATRKGTRIWNEYGFIQQYFHFLKEGEYIPGSDYDKFMQNLFSYMKIGDNQQDGAPDATAGLSRFIQGMPTVKDLFS